MKRYLLFILISAAGLILIPRSKAADYLIVCNDSGCDSGGQALFNDIVVAPGESVTRSLEIVNNDNEQINVSVAAAKTTGTDEAFLNYVSLEIHDVGGPSRFSGSVSDWFNRSVDLGAVAAGKIKAIDFTLSLADVGNDYQGKKVNFDLPVNLNVPGGGTGGGTGVSAGASPSPQLLLSGGGLVAGAQTELTGGIVPDESPVPSPESSPEILGETIPAGRDWRWLWWFLAMLMVVWLIRRRFGHH